jgi:hypothetical protein
MEILSPRGRRPSWARALKQADRYVSCVRIKVRPGACAALRREGRVRGRTFAPGSSTRWGRPEQYGRVDDDLEDHAPPTWLLRFGRGIGRFRSSCQVHLEAPPNPLFSPPNPPIGSITAPMGVFPAYLSLIGLEFDVERVDLYDRLLAYVYGGGEMFNELLLEEGYAQAYPYEPNTRYEGRFADA